MRPELRLLRVHAPRVPHGGGGGPSALLRAPRSPSSTPRRRPSWLAALALPPGRARSGSGSGSAAAPPHAAARPAQSPLRPPGPRRAGTRSPAAGLWERGMGGRGRGAGAGAGRLSLHLAANSEVPSRRGCDVMAEGAPGVLPAAPLCAFKVGTTN